jgi:hypothetical protein
MKTTFYWILALIITLASAYYQRISGPTYPDKGKHNNISYKFDRSHSVSSDQIVEINSGYDSYLHWKRFKTSDEFRKVKMEKSGDRSIAYLPAQPPAGKLEYFVTTENNGKIMRLPPEENVVTRFKGDVPGFILIPHIILIFLAMLFSVRTGIEAVRNNGNFKKLTYATLIILALGGMIFGPITQLYAFGALWTGIPFGYDLTDNKTLFAFIGWLIASYAVLKNKKPKFWVIAAAILMFIIFLIPHSMLGSELDYSKMDTVVKTPE